MANRQTLDQFNSALLDWRAFDFSKAIRSELGAEAFDQLKPIVEKVGHMLATTDRVKLELSNDVVHNMGQLAQSIKGACIGLQQVDSSQFIAQKAQVLRTIEQHLDGMMQVWPSVLSLVNAQRDSVGAQRSEIEELQKKAQQVDRLIRDLDEKAATFTKATDAISSSSIIKEEEVFSKDAMRFRIASWIWLGLIVVFSSVFLLVLNWIVKCKHPLFRRSGL